MMTGRRPRLLAGLCLVITAWLAVAGALAAEPLPDFWRGRWTIVKDLGAPGIAALSDAEAQRLLGTIVEFDDGAVRFGGEVCDDPSYATSEQTVDDFLLGFRSTRNVFRLRGDAAQVLEVDCPPSITRTLASLGNGCVITAWDGHLFQIVKLQPGSTAPEAEPPPCLD